MYNKRCYTYIHLYDNDVDVSLIPVSIIQTKVTSMNQIGYTIKQ